ncbi:WD40 repeat domain-containing protein [Paenibacillus hunanensis]|uniref:WD40 repeat protein n=1 Tax=Paenibacillus hunanensis TaxID=539262 RepID=A0ABU1IX50_9BACL|nr:WD40 repeat domain-containing protein [Paenibacillus hunanensis]MDR6243840.1 WD40 repeat protein [Paenibacillus hunanensis]GGJ25257.1 hypothetical protein GCM10008022_37700 [Paenibacillus hunanensis]
MTEKSILTNEKTFTRHRGPVTAVKHIANKKWVVTSGYDGAVGKFNLENNEVQLLGYHDHLVNSIIVSQSGKKAASVSSDYTIKIWDLEKNKLERTLRGHYDDVECFCFIDDNVGVSGSRDQRIMIWNLTTGAINLILEGHDKDVLSLTYHENKIYSSGDDKTLRVWDCDTGHQINQWGPFELETDTCAIDPLHNRIVLGCDDGHIKIFSVTTGELIKDLAAHTSGIKKVDVSPSNGDIISAAYDQKILIWDSETLELKLELENNFIKWERSLTFSNSGEQILAGTFDGTVLIWDAFSGVFLKEVGKNDDIDAGNACFNEAAVLNDDQIVTVSDDGFVRMIDLNNIHSNKYKPKSGKFLMNAITGDKKNKIVMAGSHDQKLHIFDSENGKLTQLSELALNEGPINTIRISNRVYNSEQFSFVGCYSGCIVRISNDFKSFEKLKIHEGAVKSLRLHPNKNIGISCSADGVLNSWTYDGQVIRSYLGHNAIINDLDISPTGDFIASVSRDFTLKIYDLESGDLLHSIYLGRKSLKSVCFFSDSIVVVGDYWGNVILVDLKNNNISKQMIAKNGISSINSLNDNEVLLTSYDGSIYTLNVLQFKLSKTYTEMTQRVQ